jgi:hypothetical protein
VVKPKTIKLATQQKGERALTGWFGIRTVVSVCLYNTNSNNRVGLVHRGVKYAYIIKIKLYLYTLIENICIKDTKCGCYHPELIMYHGSRL